jgi:hypothetical protein
MMRWLATDAIRRGGRFTPQPRRPFAAWPIADRRETMCWLAGAFRSWPDSFVDGARVHRVAYSDACGERGLLPYWFDGELTRSIRRDWYTPSKCERKSVEQYLRRSHGAATYFAVRSLLGLYAPESGRRPLQLAFPWD